MDYLTVKQCLHNRRNSRALCFRGEWFIVRKSLCSAIFNYRSSSAAAIQRFWERNASPRFGNCAKLFLESTQLKFRSFVNAADWFLHWIYLSNYCIHSWMKQSARTESDWKMQKFVQLNVEKPSFIKCCNAVVRWRPTTSNVQLKGYFTSRNVPLDKAQLKFKSFLHLIPFEVNMTDDHLHLEATNAQSSRLICIKRNYLNVTVQLNWFFLSWALVLQLKIYWIRLQFLCNSLFNCNLHSKNKNESISLSCETSSLPIINLNHQKASNAVAVWRRWKCLGTSMK